MDGGPSSKVFKYFVVLTSHRVKLIVFNVFTDEDYLNYVELLPLYFPPVSPSFVEYIKSLFWYPTLKRSFGLLINCY
jgi:hypothetical protein